MAATHAGPITAVPGMRIHRQSAAVLDLTAAAADY